MSDDNFFNKSINEQPATGFATELVASGALATGMNYIAGDVALTATLPLATVGAGVSVTVVVASIAAAVSISPELTLPDTINAGGAVVAAVRTYTFISDGVSNWVYTA